MFFHPRLLFATDLFKHELSEPPDLLGVLGVIHDVILHEKGLRGQRGSNQDKNSILFRYEQSADHGNSIM